MIQLNPKGSPSGSRATAPDITGSVAPRWLLLIHAIPPRPAYLRVKIGRRLQKLGAVAVKNSVYVLPKSEGTREDLEWVTQEIAADGGEASLCEARFVGGLTDEAIEEQFRSARQRDYLELARAVRRFNSGLTRRTRGRPAAEAAFVRLRKRFGEIVDLDHFGAAGRGDVEALLRSIEEKLRPPVASDERARLEVPSLRDVRGRTWVTRKGIHVDRIASAWLIRRFIDTAAKLKYVEPKRYAPAPGELRFDMFDAEFTHEGNLCTFEVLLARRGADDPALRHIADIVHDIDLRDGKFAREETSGFAALITGICLEHREDDARLAAGTTVLDALYRSLRQRTRAAR
jgi:hypothetical protein